MRGYRPQIPAFHSSPQQATGILAFSHKVNPRQRAMASRLSLRLAFRFNANPHLRRGFDPSNIVNRNLREIGPGLLCKTALDLN